MPTTQELLRRSCRALKKSPRLQNQASEAKQTSEQFSDPKFALFGGNARAFNAKADEQLLSGPAGTGKTLANLLRIREICKTYPGARCLIVRKTRESLTESVLVTWERDVLGHDNPILTHRPVIRRVRQSYTFPNGSEVVIGGIDKPQKILSSEYDAIYINESTDLNIEDWETLSSRLRSGRLPYQQLLADCNPTTPHHWLYKRQQVGLVKMFDTTHKDNPAYWDREKQEWTIAGKRYIDRLSRSLTGTRRERFLLGKWVAAEGVVYAFDPEIHQLPESWEPPASWARVWAVDWGISAPTSLGMFAIDPDGRMYHYKEFYHTHTRADLLGEWVKKEMESGREPRPYAVISDIDLDGSVKNFELTSGLHLTIAEKGDRDPRIQQMQARFDIQEDGKPRMFLRQNALAHDPDRTLVEMGKPTCMIEEIAGYVWNPDFLKDEPIADNDHAMDRSAYCVRYVNQHFPGPQATASRGSYSKAPPTPRGVDRTTGLPANLFR